MNQARANVAQAKANEEIAATTDQRWSRLVERGVLPRQSGDERRSAYLARQAESEAARAALRTSEANVISRTADLGAARANIEAQTANVRRLQQLQGFQRVLAPFDGVVTERKVERGDLVTAGSGGGRNLFTVAQARTLRIQVNVPQSYAVDLRPGQTAEILVRERPGGKFTGTVPRTAQALDPTSRTLLVEVQVENSSGAVAARHVCAGEVLRSAQRSGGHHSGGCPDRECPGDSRGGGRWRATACTSAMFRSGAILGRRSKFCRVSTKTKRVASNAPDTLVEGQQVAVQHAAGEKKQ